MQERREQKQKPPEEKTPERSYRNTPKKGKKFEGDHSSHPYIKK